MSIFAYRKHLRFLSQTHRRQWWDQRKRLTPRVRISGAYVPPSVTREFAYVKVGWTGKLRSCTRKNNTVWKCPAWRFPVGGAFIFSGAKSKV
jgi:hypothetical protein